MGEDRSEAIRSFYAQGTDVLAALNYRLDAARCAGDQRRFDYRGLTASLDNLPRDRLGRIVEHFRTRLLAAIGLVVPGVDRIAFLERLVEAAQKVGDTELAARAVCAYVLEATSATVPDPCTVASGIGMLDIYVNDCSLSLVVRADVALAKAHVLLAVGQLRQVAMAAHAAFRLARTPVVKTQCWRLLSILDQARGLYSPAIRKLERAAQAVHGAPDQTRLENAVARQSARTLLKAGQAVRGIEVAAAALHDDERLDEEAAVEQFSLALLVGRSVGATALLVKAVELREALRRAYRWRSWCTLLLELSESFVATGNRQRCVGCLDAVIRLAARNGDSVDLADALRVGAQASWQEGRIRETLASVRAIRQVLRKWRDGAKLAQTDLLRSKVAFYRGHFRQATVLAYRAAQTAVRAGALVDAGEAARIAAATARYLGMSDGARRLEALVRDQAFSVVSVDAIVPACMHLCSAAQCDGAHGESARWNTYAQEMSDRGPGARDRLLCALLASEMRCVVRSFAAARQAVELAMTLATGYDHQVLRGITCYQFLKVLALGNDLSAAARHLEQFRHELPLGEVALWTHLAQALRDGRRDIAAYKPLCALPY
jgi:hypothetical protein